AGIVHEDVDATEVFNRRVDEAATLVDVSHVRAMHERSPTPCPHALRRSFEIIDPPARDDDIRAVLGKEKRGSAADAGARAGNHRDFSVEIELLSAHLNPSERL